MSWPTARWRWAGPPTRSSSSDEDLGRSGAEATAREGFKDLVADVGLGKVGIILGIEVSRLARNNADWYQLLDLCALTDTLIADGDGLYHPGDFNDRLVLGLKGTMSEAELHLIRHRLTAGLRHKAAKGELRRACRSDSTMTTTTRSCIDRRRGGRARRSPRCSAASRAGFRPPSAAVAARRRPAAPAPADRQAGSLAAADLPGGA